MGLCLATDVYVRRMLLYTYICNVNKKKVFCVVYLFLWDPLYKKNDLTYARIKLLKLYPQNKW